MASYLRNFDVTFCFEGTETISIFTVNRKLYQNKTKKLLSSFKNYEAGADPLPWPTIKKSKKKDNLNWQQISQLFIDNCEESEEEESEWTEGSEEEESEEEEDFEDLVDEEEDSIVEEESDDDVEEQTFGEDSEDDEYESDTTRKRALSDTDTAETVVKRHKK